MKQAEIIRKDFAISELKLQVLKILDAFKPTDVGTILTEQDKVRALSEIITKKLQ